MGSEMCIRDSLHPLSLTSLTNPSVCRLTLILHAAMRVMSLVLGQVYQTKTATHKNFQCEQPKRKRERERERSTIAKFSDTPYLPHPSRRTKSAKSNNLQVVAYQHATANPSRPSCCRWCSCCCAKEEEVAQCQINCHLNTQTASSPKFPEISLVTGVCQTRE